MTPEPTATAPGGVGDPLVAVERLSKDYGRGRRRRGEVRVAPAVHEVSFGIGRGETLGLVGESGSGKSTTARCILGLLRPTSGRVLFDGLDVATLGRTEMRNLRCRMQVLFQDPFASLDPRMRCGSIVSEPLAIHGRAEGQRAERVEEALGQVGLDPSIATRKPHALSGGQRQRVALARALVLGPEFLVLDEPVSALDVSVQAQVINLLRSLQRSLGLTYLVILHDLVVARYFCDRIAVMRRGRIVELADPAALFADPMHPYTRELLRAVPGRGEAPRALSREDDDRADDALPLREIAPGHWASVPPDAPHVPVGTSGRPPGGAS